MRLTKLITGKTIWAGPSKVARRNGKAIRINAPHPETKEPSLPQAVIARWPHDGHSTALMSIKQLTRSLPRRLSRRRGRLEQGGDSLRCG